MARKEGGDVDVVEDLVCTGRGGDEEKADGTAAHGFPVPSLHRK